MNIAIIGTKGMNFEGYAFGGFETVVSNLAPRLVKAGNEVTIYCRKNRYVGSGFPDSIDGVKLKYFPSMESKNLENVSHSFLCIIDAIRSKTDVILLYQIGLGIFLPLVKMFNVQTIEHIDGLEWERGKWSPFAKLILRCGVFLSIRYADYLVSDANVIREIFLREFKSDSLVISYGAEISDDLDSKRIIEMGLAPNGYYLLATRFIPENNPLFIIETFLKTATEKKLVVLGRNYYASDYEEKIKNIKHPKVVFLGHITDRTLLLEFYKYSYVYIHGHSMGGTNPSMLEAMANNCCILALNTVFNKEMLENDKYGEFFDLCEKSFIDKINWLDSDPGLVSKMKAKTRERIENYYNWEIVTNQYLNLLEVARRDRRSTRK